METIISFTYSEGRGHATIVLDKFFPTDTTRLRKLLKMVDEDFEHRDELRATIVQHCKQRASDLLDSRKALAGKAVEHHTRATEMQPEIDQLTHQVNRLQEYVKTLKRGQGKAYREQLKGLKEKLSAKKEAQRLALSSYREYQRQFVSAEKEATKLKKNAEVTDYGDK